MRLLHQPAPGGRTRTTAIPGTGSCPGTGHLLLHDSIVTVNGRPCRMELAVNVSRYAHIFEAELSLATEQKLVECIDKLVLSDDFDAAMDQVLEIIRQQYQAAPGLCVPHRLGQGNGHQHL